MKFTDSVNAISKAYNILHNEIENVDDLKRYKLTLAEYYISLNVMEFLRKPRESTITFSENVADFFYNCGFNISWLNDGEFCGHYVISC